MSGICGIVNGDGEPADHALIQKLTNTLAFRGPDRLGNWVGGPAALGYAFLRVTDEEDLPQPASLDGLSWICADARIDGQEQLRSKLAGAGRQVGGAVDAELILNAYLAWGEDCLEHLIGDFSFAIWDARLRRLFCARDQFGVKPFFYSRPGRGIVFSNTLECVRAHPGVSSALDEQSIGDFLLFEHLENPEATIFAAIRRLPPAHFLLWSDAGLRVERYWRLPDVAVIERSESQCLDEFRAVFSTAVSDRLRTNRVALELSGGLDSGSVAAVALAELSKRDANFELSAHTMVFHRLIPDQEGRYAGMVAARLGIPVHFSVADDFELLRCEDPSSLSRPEPINSPVPAMESCTSATAERFSRVVLTGWDGDNLLNESPRPYFEMLARQGRFLRLAGGLLGYAVSHPRFIAMSLRARLARAGGWKIRREEPGYPTWLQPEFERRMDLKGRWQRFMERVDPPHPLRPYAFRGLGSLLESSSFFDFCDSGFTLRHLEFRHPLLDLRVMEFCLSLPPWPWCVQKRLLRSAMKGVLPRAVLARPKSPMAGAPHMELMRRDGARRFEEETAFPGLDTYVDWNQVASVWGRGDATNVWTNLRPLSLNLWLRSQMSVSFGDTA